jgi:hypothetical protein
MDLSKIISVAGKPGLFKILTQSRGGVVVESLTDGRKMAIGQTQRVSTLSDISVYTTEGDVPLKDILSKIIAHTGGKEVAVDLNNNNALRAYFTELIPDHDQERVYVSDIKKLIKWYATLREKNLLGIEEEAAPKKTKSKAPSKAKASGKSKVEETPEAETTTTEEPSSAAEKE